MSANETGILNWLTMRSRSALLLSAIALIAVGASGPACGEDGEIGEAPPASFDDAGSGDDARAIEGGAVAPDGGSPVDAGGDESKLASFVVQTQPTMISDAFNLAQPAAIAAVGGTGITLAYYFYQSNRFLTEVDDKKYDGTASPTRPTDAALAAWTRAAKAAHLTVTLKPHLQLLPGNGPPPPWTGATPPILPGGPNHPGDLGSRQVSGKRATGEIVTTSCDKNGIITASPSAASSEAFFTQDDVGRRILTARGEVPNTTLSEYGTVSPGDPGQPAWNTIETVLSSTRAKVKVAPPSAIPNFTMYVINDDPTHGAHAWFLDWQTKLDHLVDVMMQNGGCDWLNLSTEQRPLTVAFDGEFRKMIAFFRRKYPSLALSLGPNGEDGLGNSNLLDFTVVHFWDALGASDGVGGGRGLLALDGYMDVQSPSDPQPLALATVKANWLEATATNGNLEGGWAGRMMAIRATWQARFPAKDFRWMFSEWGYRSVAGAGISGNADLDPTGGAVNQATCIQGFLETVWPNDWFLGFNYWAFVSPLGDPVELDAPVSFEPKAQAIVAFEKVLK